MRIGVMQPNYISWRGYFDYIASCDLFVIYDCVQYSTGTWRNRNLVKTPRGLQWLTVPVHTELGTPIKDVRIGKSRRSWRESHRRLLHEALGPAPFFSDALRLWEDGVRIEDSTICELDLRLIRVICEYIQVSTPLVLSSTYQLTGAKTERLMALFRKLDASTYLSGPSAAVYLDEQMFRDNGMRLEYKTYDYRPYPQLFGDFEASVTILDLIANKGPEAIAYVRSTTPNCVVVE